MAKELGRLDLICGLESEIFSDRKNALLTNQPKCAVQHDMLDFHTLLRHEYFGKKSEKKKKSILKEGFQEKCPH
jgi:hypothetical protein